MDEEAALDFVRWANDNRFRSPAHLARSIGVNRSSVGRWLDRKSAPARHNIERLAKNIGLTFDDVINRRWQDSVQQSQTMYMQDLSGGGFSLSGDPPELISAVQWHVSTGENPKRVRIAASKARLKAVFDGHRLSRLDWIGAIQDWLDKLPEE